MKQKSLLLILIMTSFIACSQKEAIPVETDTAAKISPTIKGTTFSLPHEPPAIVTPSGKEHTLNAYKEKKLQEHMDAVSKKDGRLEDRKNKYATPYHDNNHINPSIEFDIPKF